MLEMGRKLLLEVLSSEDESESSWELERYIACWRDRDTGEEAGENQDKMQEASRI